MDCLIALLDSASVAAFIGAFSAFLLVILNDWRRDRRTLVNIKNEVEMNRDQAKGKLGTLMTNHAALKDQDLVIYGEIIRFSTGLIRALSTSVLHRFSGAHRRALDALCYMMEATDNLLSEINKTTEGFRPSSGLSDEERIVLVKELNGYYHDGIVNMRRLIVICNFYLEGNYKAVLSKKYIVEEYQE